MPERALILAPRGRDAALAQEMLREAGLNATSVASLPDLVAALADPPGYVILTEEEIARADTAPLSAWRDAQPEWSDLPFILLTAHGGLERNPAAARWLDLLGNVTFVERPFHPTTLVSLARSALRARRKQYDARARMEALHRSEDRFRGAVEAVQGVLWTNTADGRMLGEQPGWGTMTGQSYDDYQDFGWTEAVHPDDAQPTIDAWTEAVARQGLFAFEHRVCRHDHVWRTYSIRAIPTFTTDGELREWVGVHTDITAQREAEAALNTLNAELSERVETAVAERAAAQDALRQSQKMEAIGQLTGGVAHDFNNLLTVIRSSSDLLRRPDLSDERRRRYLDAIADTADRAAKLTHQLLTFSRRQAVRLEVFDVGARLVAIADMLRTLVGARVAVSITAAPDLVVEADASQFETAIVNLCVNARDAMAGDGRIVIDAARVGERVEVTVRDSGTGIASDVLPKLFEPFFTTKDVGKGTGLGLSQVYGFTAQAGGEVRVDSEVGHGATFTIALPLTQARPAATVPQQPVTKIPRGGRILVVEDNPEIRDFAVQLLTSMGYEPVDADSADAALTRIDGETRPFDLVFTDVVMPGTSGIDLARNLRARLPTLPIVLTSGYSDALANAQGSEFPLLQKPYSSEKLTDAIEAALR